MILSSCPSGLVKNPSSIEGFSLKLYLTSVLCLVAKVENITELTSTDVANEIKPAEVFDPPLTNATEALKASGIVVTLVTNTRVTADPGNISACSVAMTSTETDGLNLPCKSKCQSVFGSIRSKLPEIRKSIDEAARALTPSGKPIAIGTLYDASRSTRDLVSSELSLPNQRLRKENFFRKISRFNGPFGPNMDVTSSSKPSARAEKSKKFTDCPNNSAVKFKLKVRGWSPQFSLCLQKLWTTAEAPKLSESKIGQMVLSSRKVYGVVCNMVCVEYLLRQLAIFLRLLIVINTLSVVSKEYCTSQVPDTSVSVVLKSISKLKPNSTWSINRNTIQEIHLVNFNEELLPIILAARSHEDFTSSLKAILLLLSLHCSSILATTTSIICKRETKSDAHTSSNFTVLSSSPKYSIPEVMLRLRNHSMAARLFETPRGLALALLNWEGIGLLKCVNGMSGNMKIILISLYRKLKAVALLTYETYTEKYSDRDCSCCNRSLLSNEVASCRNRKFEENTNLVQYCGSIS
ncbi:hypothetical protein GQX74_001531 [Glossina fuscipes]|nr:hypothetical protein GQX74_001531 [Glossina fuscipes]